MTILMDDPTRLKSFSEAQKLSYYGEIYRAHLEAEDSADIGKAQRYRLRLDSLVALWEVPPSVFVEYEREARHRWHRFHIWFDQYMRAIDAGTERPLFPTDI